MLVVGWVSAIIQVIMIVFCDLSTGAAGISSKMSPFFI